MNSRKLLMLSLLLLLVFFMAACGAAQSQTQTADSTAVDPGEVSSSAVSLLPGIADQEAPAIAPSVASPSLVAAASEETDAGGIEVGFTEEGRPYRGNPNAPIVLEEFSDFQCPFCARFTQQTLPGLEENYIASGDVVLIYYDFPLTSIHPQAVAAANAARCAGEQSAAAFWQMHDQLFASTAWEVSDPNPIFAEFAAEFELDMEPFISCLESGKFVSAVEADVELGVSRGVRSTPSFFINGQPFIGAQPLSAFNAAIEAVSRGDQLAQQEPEPEQPAARPTPATVNLETAAATLGDPNAPVTIVEYTDYQCSFCGVHSTETLPQIVTELVETGSVYYVLMDYPLDQLHPNARAAAIAARCAGEQDAYWEMHDALFAEQNEWSSLTTGLTNFFVDLARSLNLAANTFISCLDDERQAAAVQASVEQGAALGVQGTPHFFLNGNGINGAQPIDFFIYAADVLDDGRITVTEGDAFVLGDRNAPVTIVEYTDFQCPYCFRHFSQTFPQIREQFIETGVVRYVFKDFPLTNIHPQAVLAAEAARCAGEQDAYLEMHHALFAGQQEWSNQPNAQAIFVDYAAAMELETDAFASCLDSRKYTAAVEADMAEGMRSGVNGTPAFLLNGYFLSGAQPFSVFEQAINQLAAQED